MGAQLLILVFGVAFIWVALVVAIISFGKYSGKMRDGRPVALLLAVVTAPIAYTILMGLAVLFVVFLLWIAS